MINKNFDINESGYSVRCILFCNDPRDIDKVVIYAHGFGGHKENKASEKFAEKLLSKHKKAAVIAYDLPCHGKDSSPRLTLDLCNLYIDLLVNHVKTNLNATDVYMYATSFGGYLTLKYIHDKSNPFNKIALRCPAINMYDSLTSRIMTEENFALLAKGRDVLVGFDRKIKINQAFIEELKQADITKYDYIDYADDIIVLHGTKDEVVPFDVSQSFCDENVIEFIPFENADHRFIDPQKMDLAIHEIIQFLDM